MSAAEREIFVFSLDPGAPAGATIHPNTGEITFTATDGPAVHTFTVRVNDNGCGCAADTFSDTETFTVTVGNLPPTAGVTGPALAVRGQPVAFTLTATDPSAEDQAAGFTYLVDLNDGTVPQTVAASANNGAGVLLDHVFAQDGTYNVSVTATDKDGATSSPAATHAIIIASSAVMSCVNVDRTGWSM